MKTIEELCKEIMENEDAKKEFLSLTPGEVSLFLRKYDCNATLEEIKGFLAEKNISEHEMSDEELDGVVGGNALTDLGETVINLIKLIIEYPQLL